MNGRHGVTVDGQNSVSTVSYYPDPGFRVALFGRIAPVGREGARRVAHGD